MIHYIKGDLALKLEDRVVVETGGLGFEVFVPSNSKIFHMDEGAPVKIFTAMMVKEDDVSLYGFSDGRSLRLFHRLLTVSGVGAKAALSLLSTLSPEEISKAIVFGDAAALARANGIGKKTAERVILELKDKTEIIGGAGEATQVLDLAAQAPGNPQSDAVEALVSLGYSRTEAATAVASAGLEQGTAEEYIKLALKTMFRP
ncbi:MAG: Holliday junction branch migration protein RuvA [Clostridiales Family XIII bacterium]|jgi:Holliday junction DNA helicase RuvA|nr:Holliday junction branch migration protein RuvA [Clostridiales Family XIII bacterium]